MTDEELDMATVAEACRRTGVQIQSSDPVSLEAARLGRAGWQPEDPLLKEAREIATKGFGPMIGPAYRAFIVAEGDDVRVELALRALRRGIEIGRGV